MQKNFRVVFFFPTARKGIDCSLPWESQPLSSDLLKISKEMIRNSIRNIFFFPAFARNMDHQSNGHKAESKSRSIAFVVFCFGRRKPSEATCILSRRRHVFKDKLWIIPANIHDPSPGQPIYLKQKTANA